MTPGKNPGNKQLFGACEMPAYAAGPAPEDLLLVNAHILTMDPRLPAAASVAVRGGVITAVGNPSCAAASAGAGARTIDCQGLTLVPGLIDAHCHLLAQASALRGMDCGPDAASSIAGLQRLARTEAAKTPPGRWVRGYGYDDLSLAEKRHPNRHDLDQAVPHHPARLDHRSGHASVLNGPALALAGIGPDTPDPPEGVIQRDPATGQPTGLLLEMAGWLRDKLGPSTDDSRLADGVRQLNHALLRRGVTSAQDAGPGNGLSRWQTFRQLRDDGLMTFRVTMMAGFSRLDELAGHGMTWGAGGDRLRLGHVKIMLTMTTGALYPPAETLREMVDEAHRRGFPVAVHAVEQDAVAAVARVLTESNPPTGRIQPPADRIEHCSECPPDLARQVKASGATVVTQPGFLYWNGERYLQRVAPELLPHLYPIGALRRAAVPVAFGSDAPAIDPNPWPGIYGAVARTSREGSPLPDWKAQAVTAARALSMHTAAGAAAEGSGHRKGSISPGKLADLALLDANPLQVERENLKNIRSALTIIGGRVVWNGGMKIA